MNTLIERPNKQKSVDWLAIKLLYTENHRISYSDIAEMFGVSLKQVKKHGARENFVESRQQVSDSVEIKIKEKVADDRVEANERHRIAYKNLQALANVYVTVIANHNQSVIEKAKVQGCIVNPNELYSPSKLLMLCKSIKLAIDGERVTLNLPSIIVAPAGWKPPHSKEPEVGLSELPFNDWIKAIGLEAPNS
ncbi:MAG TPA: hypothetical protein VMR34_00965 [Candidatus Saccharimonadales bacterium]|nr:hypothetical protein [Candidatus Saccharimonadales bacterium]